MDVGEQVRRRSARGPPAAALRRGHSTVAHPRTSYALSRFEDGEGSEVLILLHGLGGTHRYWTCGSVPFSISNHRRVLLDLLGFGASPRPWMRYTLDRHLAALDVTLARESRVTLVGHSLGAALALAYAARWPERVVRLVLISPPCFQGVGGAAAWFAQQPGGWIYTNLWATALACFITRRIAGRLLPRLLADMPREVAEDLVAHNMASSATSLWEVLYRHDLLGDAALLPPDIPVLVIHGARDSTAPPDGTRLLAAGRGAWHLEMLEGQGHHPWLRAPKQCLARIESWLGAVPSEAT